MNKVTRYTLFPLLIIVMSVFSNPSLAAFCSLRDPVETIKKLYPDSTSYKSNVRIIDEGIRDQVQKLLPPNTLHFSELGKHTLYIAYKGERPIGYVHVRSEESDWGLVEVAWAMTLDLQVQDFIFQRCRSRAKKTLEHIDFKAQLQGRTYHDFVEMLNGDGLTLNVDKIHVDSKAKSLAEVVILCGMKTLLVTELAWASEVQKNALYRSAELNFEGFQSIDIIENPVNESVDRDLNTIFDGADTGIDRSSVIVAKVHGNDQKLLGLLYVGKIKVDGQLSSLEWALSPDGQVMNVNNHQQWKDVGTRDAFQRTIGKSYTDSKQCNNRAELITLEAVITSRSLLAL